MPGKFFTVRHLFLLLLVVGQSQVGFGQDGEGDGDDYENYEYEPTRTFTAVSSLLFRPGTDYKVFFTVNPHPKNKPLRLKCILMAKSVPSTIIRSAPISLRPGESGLISIPLPQEMPLNETVWRLFAWSFTEKSSGDGYKWEAPYTLIYSSLGNQVGQSLQNADLASIFIQTDKPVYKPDDLVRIRVITMGTNDLPHLTSGVNMIITDSQGNIMKRWEQPLELPESASQPSNVSSSVNGNVALFGEFQKKKNGLSSYEYQLSSEPILGNWTIQVEAGNIKERVDFEVQKYILPKFQVKIQAPSVLYGVGEISAAATIKVSYTYGKNLQGTVTVTSNNTGGAATKIQQIVVKDGEVKVPLTFTSSSSDSTVHTITANVTEKNTGRWQIGKAKVRIYPRETYSVQWINKPALYKPGIPITAQLKITSQDGFPVKGVGPNFVGISFSPSLNLTAKETSIPLSGIVTFTFPTPLHPMPANSKFQVEYKRSTFDFNLPAAARGSSSGIFLEILSPPDSLNLIQGQSYNFTIRSNKPIQPELFYCILWDEAAMEVHGAQTIVNNNLGQAAREFPFSIQIPKATFKKLKIFVYYETVHNRNYQTISTFKSIKTVNNYLNIRVSRPTPIKTPAPTPEINNSTVPSNPDAPNDTAEEPVNEDVDYARDDPGAVEAEEPERQSEISERLEVEPGATVEIHFETYPDSTVAIRGIDQSLLLLLTEQGQDNDLNQEAVESKRAFFQPRQFNPDEIQVGRVYGCDPYNHPFLRTFQPLGIAVLHGTTYSFDEPYLCPTSFGGNSLEEPEMAPSPNLVAHEPTVSRVDSRLRTKFPETWLWEEFESSSNSTSTVLSKTLPDTLTSWIISGFSLNPRKGLGVASPATITGFMPFFVTLNLPYSVVKYESFELQIIVHNYLDRDVNVFVTLFNRHKDFEFNVTGRENSAHGNKTRSIKVERNNAALAHFVITPLVFGDIPIEVKVVTEDGSAGDSMLRHLKVKPDGVRESRSQVVTFDAKPGTTNLSREAIFDVNFPKKVVKGASSLQLTVIGDPMATIVSSLGSSSSSRSSNLGHLLQVPSGCGEQNMIGLVPNILALHYLTATESKAKDVMKQAKRNLERGYGNQLKYRKSDGSFAVWSNEDGTTWLTAYVLQWFTVAQQYITIDPNVIRGAINFIKSKQQTDGSFVETGTFYHPEMRGQTGSAGVALTAFITLALIQANETSSGDLNLRVAIENGMNFFSKESVYQQDDNYITNLVTATLMAGNHPEGPRFFEKMENGAKTTINLQGAKVKYWDTINQTEWASGPLAIEMTSYALLAHLWKKEEIDGSVVDIHRWLLSQRNPNGGFLSTQDTALGLTALTEYALRTKTKFVDVDPIELNIRTSSSSLSNSSNVNTDSIDTELKVSVLRWNQMVLQEFKLPVSAKKVNLHARGSGQAIVQMTETWYVPIRDKFTTNPSDHFNITAKMRIPDPKEPSETELKFCVNSISKSGARDSIASIQLPSGYIFSPEDYEDNSEFTKRRPGNVQRFELSDGDSKMDVYYTEIKGHPPTCLSLASTQQFEVAKVKNPPIHVYEYLNPARQGRIVYEPAHNITLCQLCRQRGGCDDEECG